MHTGPLDLLAEDLCIRIESRLAGRLEPLIERALSRTLENRPLDRPGVDWLNNADAKAALGVSTATLARWRETGRLRFSKVGKLVWYHRADIEAMLAESRRTP